MENTPPTNTSTATETTMTPQVAEGWRTLYRLVNQHVKSQQPTSRRPGGTSATMGWKGAAPCCSRHSIHPLRGYPGT